MNIAISLVFLVVDINSKIQFWTETLWADRTVWDVLKVLRREKRFHNGKRRPVLRSPTSSCPGIESQRVEHLFKYEKTWQIIDTYLSFNQDKVVVTVFELKSS